MHQRVIGAAFPGADKRHQRGGGRRVLDHTAPRAAQAEHVAQPIGGDFLDFGEGRAGLPGQPNHTQAGAQAIAQH